METPDFNRPVCREVSDSKLPWFRFQVGTRGAKITENVKGFNVEEQTFRLMGWGDTPDKAWRMASHHHNIAIPAA